MPNMRFPMVEPRRPHEVRLEPAIERDTAALLQPSKAVRLRAASGVATASGGSVTVEISSPGWLAPRPLSGKEEALIGAVASLGTQYAAMHGASPELTLFVGLALFLLLREFTRRVLPPG
jgi:hypothetical protein